jgi:hypothetical protein
MKQVTDRSKHSLLGLWLALLHHEPYASRTMQQRGGHENAAVRGAY